MSAGVVGALFLFVLPVPHTVTIRLVALIVMAVLCVLLIRREGLPPIPLKSAFAAWLAVALVSLSYAVNYEYSLGEIKSEIGYAFVTYAVFYCFGWHLRIWTPWLWAIFLGLVLLSISNVILWFSTGVAIFSGHFYNGVGAFTTYLLTVLPFIVLLLFRLPVRRRLARIAVRLVPLLFLIPAYFSLNRWVWVSLAVTAAVLFLLLGFVARNRAQRVSSVLALCMLVGLSAVLLYVSLERRLVVQAKSGPVINETIALDPRPQLWHFVYDEIAAHPLTGAGFGMGSFNYAYPQWKKQNGVLFHAHNVFLDAGVQMGLPGVLIMVLLFTAVMRQYWGLYQGDQRLVQWIGACGIAMVIGVVTKNMTDEFFRRDLAMLFWALVGMSLGYGQRKQRESSGSVATTALLSAYSPADSGARLKFLVIRRDNIGDLVCTTPLFSALRQRFPRAQIFALVNTYNAAILERNPDIDAVYSYVKTTHAGARLRALLQRIGLLIGLRRKRIDYAILAGSGSKHSLNLARALRPKHIIGYDVPGRSSVIDMVVPRPPDSAQLHQVEYAYRLLEPVGIIGKPPALRLFPDPAEVALSRQKLERAAPTSHASRKILVAIQISSRKPVNRWPAEKFAELVRKLWRAHDAYFLLLWAPGSRSNPRHPGDDETAAEILRLLEGVPVVAYPQGTLRQLIADLSLCDCVVTSDGGAMHIAAALGKPMVCFFGDAASAHWKPWNSMHVLLQPASGRVSDIDVDEALAAFERLSVRDSRTHVSGPGVRPIAKAQRFQSESGNF